MRLIMFKQICNYHDKILHVFYSIATSVTLHDNNSCCTCFINEILYLSRLELGKHKLFYFYLKFIFAEWNARTISRNANFIFAISRYCNFKITAEGLWRGSRRV